MKIEIDKERLMMLLHDHVMSAEYGGILKTKSIINIHNFIKEIATKTAIDHGKNILKNVK